MAAQPVAIAAFETLTDCLVILTLVVVLCVLYIGWLASYRTPKASLLGTSIWFRLPVWGQIAVGLGMSVAGAYGVYRLWMPIFIAVSPLISLVLRIIGLVVTLGGALLFLVAKRTLGAMYGASTSSAVQLQANHRLIQNGIYAIVRHPIYLSYWIMLVGLVIMYRTGVLLMLLLLMVISLSKRAYREDQAMESTFGDKWRNYARRVPMFVPQWE